MKKKNPPLPPQLELYHGVIRVRGTRVPLDVLVNAFECGATPEETCLQYPSVTIGHAYSAIAYYLNNRDAVGQYMKRRKTKQNKLRAQHETTWPPAGLRQRLLERLQLVK